MFENGESQLHSYVSRIPENYSIFEQPIEKYNFLEESRYEIECNSSQ